ncbi:MAG: hypothetical protein FJ395_11875 [Verrucomicrobia bacterium]|nr:hypothetical protein [Verrucomicrobiota bacterium]
MKSILIAFTLAVAASAAQLDELIPKLADEVVTNRYAAQMELQAIASNASKPGNERAGAALGSALAAKAADASVPQPARVWIIRQLEYMGRGEAVPALTILLNGTDAELRECARRALEKNPDPKAVEPLRAALQKGGDINWKIGLAHSLGEKRDAKSVVLIAPLLTDPKAGSAAAKALGAIASREAVAALWNVFGRLDAANEALVCAGNRDASQAAAIGKRLYAECPLSPVRAAALTLVAKSEPKLVEDALVGHDVRLQKTAVDLLSPAKLAAMLPKLPDTAKVFALRVIDSEKTVLDCTTEKGEAIRVAALERLSDIGGAASVPALINAAANGSELEKVAAVASLSRVNGDGAGQAIVRQAGQGSTATRVVAITALAARVEKAALSSLLAYAGEADAEVSKAALASIGKIGGDESLDGLVKLVLANKPGAKDALQAVAGRSANKSVVGRKLAAQAQSAGVLEVMSLVGGADALAAVVKLATAGNDDAIRALCQWREFAAVKPLLDVAAAPGVKQVHHVLAIQAVCRLVKAGENEPAQARVDAALAALQAAGREQEKKQVMSALASVKDRKAADSIIKLLTDASVRTDAAHAALSLADGLRKQDRGSAKKLAEAVKKANISSDLNKKAEQSLKKK